MIDEKTVSWGPHDRVVKRPVRRERYDETPDDIDEHIRLECLDCGKAIQGLGIAVDRVFRDRGCEHTPERYRAGVDQGGEE